MEFDQIGAKLRELRKQKGLSQGDIEKSSGLLRCYVSRVENGHDRPGLEVLERWLKPLGVGIAEFFSDGAPRPVVVREISVEDKQFLIEVGSYILGAKAKAQLIELVKQMAAGTK